MNKYLISIKEKFKKVGLMKVFVYILLTLIDPLIRKLWTEPFLKSYSQKYEDIIIDRLLKFKKRGFYIDIGANDPDNLNNTKRFYNKGWYGINIEPNPILFKKLQLSRNRDLNLNIGISNHQHRLLFHIFDPHTLSTFSKKQADIYELNGNKITKKTSIKTFQLKEVFKKYVKNKKIDFISIDTEGYDMLVLKSNDWSKYKPMVICIESTIDKNINKRCSETDSFLKLYGYHKITTTIHFGNPLNSIYLKNNQIL